MSNKKKNFFFVIHFQHCACMLNFHERLFLFSFCNLNFSHGSFISSKLLCFVLFLSSLLSQAHFSHHHLPFFWHGITIESALLKVCLGFFFGEENEGRWEIPLISSYFMLYKQPVSGKQTRSKRKKNQCREAGEHEKERKRSSK